MARVHIVGGGPAGSIAAISALRNGHDVHVYEEHAQAGIPENCSGHFSKECLESLSGFIDYKPLIINEIHGADIHFLDETVSVRRNSPVSFVCSRSGLDQALASRAEQEGAKISYSSSITRNPKLETGNQQSAVSNRQPETGTQPSGSTELGGQGEETSFPRQSATGCRKPDAECAIIGADGPFSSVAKMFDFPKISRYVSTLQALLPYKSEDPHKVDVFFSNTLFPGFFGWIIPHDEYFAEFGVGVLAPSSPSSAWRALMKLKSIENFPKPRGHAIPLAARSCTAKRIGKTTILLAGDAAGQVKSTTGGGFVFGMQCAALAGRYAVQPWRYELEWRLKYGPDLSIHKMLHSHLSCLSDDGMKNLGRQLKNLGCDKYLSDHGHMDKPLKMIKPQFLTHIAKAIANLS